jgi:acylphosphatase
MARLNIEVRGRVQGVGFRFFVQSQAQRFDLTGWVRNQWDGGLEIEAEGSRRDLLRFLEAIRRGPGTAHVENVDPVWGPYTGQHERFEVKFW